LEAQDKLRDALEDYQQLSGLEPHNQKVRAAVARLEPLVEQRREAEKAEMLDKLKGMGNMLLGKFGSSSTTTVASLGARSSLVIV
jgi:ferritin-like metal-binding protein YciE